MNKLTTFFFLLFVSLSAHTQTIDTIYHERIYIGTGEYDPTPDWHGILRFEDARNYNSGALCDTTYTPEGVIPVKQCFDNSVFLNFAHGLYFNEANDRMYVSTLFTNAGNFLTKNSDTAVGSIAIFDNISTLTGGQIPTRHIFGDSTQLKQPHGCWLDESRDMLYVANTFGCNILVFHNASTRNGNTPPDRVISSPIPNPLTPLYIYIDELADRMFVASGEYGCADNPKIAIYGAASLINGELPPIVNIEGSNTRLGFRNPTVHNVWYNSNNGLLAVGHHTHEMLFFDMNTVNMNPSLPTSYDMTPRVLMINENASLSDTSNHNLYGFYWDVDRDIMYISDGISGMGPTPNSPPNVLKIYENVSDTAFHGIVTPNRTICWSNGDVYFPPQPIWVQKTMEIVGVGIDEQNKPNFNLYPNPANDYFIVELPVTIQSKKLTVVNSLGQVISTQLISGNQIKVNTQTWSKGMYVVKIDGFGESRLVKQ